MNRHIKRVAPGEAAFAQAVIAVVNDDDEAEAGAGNPHGRSRSHDDRNPSERGSHVEAVALLGSHLRTRQRYRDRQVFGQRPRIASSLLAGCRHDDDGAPRGDRRRDGLGQTATQVWAQHRGYRAR